MKEFQPHVDYYSTYWWSSFTKMLPEEEWGNKKLAKEYLEKYWLTRLEYEQIWASIQEQVFINQKEGLPKLIFTKQFKIIGLRGGMLFGKTEFKRLQECMLDIGDKYFVIVENTFGEEPFVTVEDILGWTQEPAFRMKYPTDISWAEITSGNFISSVLLEMYYKEYFVFGESGEWGMYAATEYEKPLNLIGFKSQYDKLFKEKLKQSKGENEEIKKWFPSAYKQIIDKPF